MDSPFQHLRGPFNFLDATVHRMRLLFPEVERALPSPGIIFLEDEDATPVRGFPVRFSEPLEALSRSLARHVVTEEAAEADALVGGRPDIHQRRAAWDDYRAHLARISENLAVSNYGRNFPQIFWLLHSRDLQKALAGTSVRVRKRHSQIDVAQADGIRYKVLDSVLERVFTLVYDLAGRMSRSTDQPEEELFPPLLQLMRDNVLIFTEAHISRDLKELKGYFRGYLQTDGDDFLYRLALLRRWHDEVIRDDRRLRAAARQLLGAPKESRADDLIYQTGYVTFLQNHEAYDARNLLDSHQIQLWESLLQRLKEYELMRSMRQLIVELPPDGSLLCSARSAARIGAGAGDRRVTLNVETRPLDFAMPWIVDPEVSRGGLIYDIADFSAMVSLLRVSDRSTQDESFRAIFSFQRDYDILARRLRLRWEKYLGDGVFYSGRNLGRMLVAAILMQRKYKQAVANSFPFDRGMRIALNYGTYRLLPLGASGTAGERYEVFGHGMVELSRLVSGKRSLDVDEIRNILVSQGYTETSVLDFFAPFASDTGGRPREGFHVSLRPDGSLVNEGIVATETFLQELTQQVRLGALHSAEVGRLRYVVFELPVTRDSSVVIGVRRIGLANLKGLGKLPVYEILDAAGQKLANSSLLAGRDLVTAAKENFSTSLAR